MSLSVVVRLREGRYDAGGLDPLTPEWPPHPARVLCALLASAVDEADRAALCWLESAGIPVVWAAQRTSTTQTTNYVVTNKIAAKGSQTWPARTNGASQRSGVLPHDDTYAIVWTDADPDDLTLARLVRLAGRVPYVGRSTSPAEVNVVDRVVAPRAGWVCWNPVPLGTTGAVGVRIPHAGYVDALASAFEDGVRAWQVPVRTAAYAVAATVEQRPEETPEIDGPYSDLLVWGLRRPSIPIAGDDLLTVTEALRRAVLSRVADPVPEQISGHDADGRPHVAFLGLPDVGHAHADGHMLGVAVAVPREMAHSARQALLRGLLGPSASDPMSELRYRRQHRLELNYAPTIERGLQPQRWGVGRGHSRWVTATPLMLDRYPKNPKRVADIAESVAAALVTAGYPQPAWVEPLVGCEVAGGVWRLRPGTLPLKPRRPVVHCRVTFSTPVRGPVVAGALRYLGGGLLVPETLEASGADN